MSTTPPTARRLRPIGAGFAGGVLAGAVVGAAEALALWWAGEALRLPLGWAITVYALVGGAGGVVAGAAAAALRTDGFGLGLGTVAAGLVFVVGRFRMLRHLLPDSPPLGTLAVLAQLTALAVLAAAAVAIFRATRGADARRGLLTRPGPVAAVVVFAAFAGVVAGRLVSAPAPTRAPRPPVAAMRPAPRNTPNVMLVVVDSLRPDRLGCYGYRRAQTSTIDGIAKAGLRFRNAFAQASSTRPSVGTILTGLYPSSHGMARETDVLAEGLETLPELLARGGFQTAAFTSSADLAPTLGFDQGFAEYHHQMPDRALWADGAAAELALYDALRRLRGRLFPRTVDVHAYYQPAEETVDAALDWLDRAAAQPAPFFLYLHLMDAHEPYMAHPFDGVGYGRDGMPNPAAGMATTLSNTYDGAIAYLDASLGLLVGDLERRGLFDRTMIVVTSDHGEEFHEHGGWWHGTTLYDEQMRVPLILKGAATGVAGRIVQELATSLDVAPTILAAVGLEVPATMQGLPLPVDPGPAPERDGVFAEQRVGDSVLQAVRTPRWKLVVASAANPRGPALEELYDVVADPGETKNLAATEPATREELQAMRGRKILEARARAAAREAAGRDSDEQRRRLESLGYIEKAKEKEEEGR